MGTTSRDVLTKQPGETRKYCLNFGPLLGSGETLSSGAAVAVTALGRVDGAAAISPSSVTINSAIFTDPVTGETTAANEGVTCVLAGGTDQEDYLVEGTATTSASNILEVDGVLRVRD